MCRIFKILDCLQHAAYPKVIKIQVIRLQTVPCPGERHSGGAQTVLPVAVGPVVEAGGSEEQREVFGQQTVHSTG